VRWIGAARLILAASVAVLACACGTASAGAATREPISVLEAALNGEAARLPTAADADRRPVALASTATTGVTPSVTSVAFGPDQTEAVARVIAGLDHGPELASQHVFVATAEEVASRCGEEVIACYFPATEEMVVAGSGGARGGVPRDFAIAHEYGHAIADSQTSPIGSAMETGTIRWATYERVCQLSRAGLLFPGNQGGHYWQDPEEAFAETYAELAEPAASVPWQFSNFLAPTPASLAKVRADVAHPWNGPTTLSWDDTVGAVPAPSAPRVWGSARAGISSAESLGPPSGTVAKTFSAPLDGEVEMSLATGASTPVAVSLVDPTSGRTLVRARTDAAGEATASFQNCGHESLRVEVRDLGSAPVSFAVRFTRP
jgi:hypothetical protein